MTPAAQRLATDHRRLVVELERLEAAGACVPCRVAGVEAATAWVSEDIGEQQVAARACWPCPALEACAEYAAQHPSECGVYAGLVERERRPLGRPRKRATDAPEASQ